MNIEDTVITQTRDEAYQAINEIRTKYLSNKSQLSQANEAKTRLLIINRVLNILGWKSEEFNPEEPVAQVGFTDYILTSDDVPRILVEAKRVSHTFHSPTVQLKKLLYKLSYIRSAFGPALTEVIEQAENYTQQNGMSYALLSNGGEWILAQLRVLPGYDNVDDLNCYYFGNLFSNDFQFDVFWELLYKPFVDEGRLEEQFAHINSKEADYIGSALLDTGELHWHRSYDNHNLDDFYQYFFTDMVDNARRQMLEKCFVSSARLDQYQGDLNRALKDSIPEYAGTAKELSPDASEEFLLTDSGDKRGRVILITGSVGCGKSTFVAKVLSEARNLKKGNQVIVKVDLIDDAAIDYDNVVQRLWQKLMDEWLQEVPNATEYEQLQKIFARDLQILKNGANSKRFAGNPDFYEAKEAEELEKLMHNAETFILACCKFYREKKHAGIAIFFDNVDRASESYQKQVYGIAHKIANETGATVAITMREATFFRGQNVGFLDVRTSDTVFHLQSPNLEQVLSRRIKYIEDYLENDVRASKWKKKSNWNVFQVSIQDHSQKLKSEFLSAPDGRDKLGILASIAWHDVRYFLRILKDLHSHLGTTATPWNIPQIIAVLMSPIEDGNPSPAIPNIYQPSFQNYKCYFLKVRILLLLTYGVRDHEVSYGVAMNKILRFSRLYGYERRWTEKAIEEMVQSRLLESIEAPAERDFTKDYRLVKTHTFRRSPLAVTLITQIMTEPIYLCLIGNELPFHNAEALQHYIKILKDVIYTLEDGMIQPEAIDLFTDNGLGQVVARYLMTVYSEEQPDESTIKYDSEVATTERKLAEIISKLSKFAPPLENAEVSNSGVKTQNLPLFNADIHSDWSDFETVAKPEIFTNITSGKVNSIQLVFWSLVALRLIGENTTGPSRITEIINRLLVDDQNPIASVTTSRTLRTLLSQGTPWLISTARGKYSIANDWKTYWEALFGTPYPSSTDI